MARSFEEKHELFDEFVLENMPRWLFHPQVLTALRLKHILVANRVTGGARGMAWSNVPKIAVHVELVKFRHASPYTTPKGKSDISPIGVIAHEIGHMLEFAVSRRGWWNEDGWRAIHKVHKKTAITSYARVHPMEDFAEANRLFVLNPKLLKELSPERHAYVKHCWRLLLGAPLSQFKQSKQEFTKQWRSVALHTS